MASLTPAAPRVNARGPAQGTPPPAPPVELANACCPKCWGPVCWSAARWLFCPRCTAARKAGGK